MYEPPFGGRAVDWRRGFPLKWVGGKLGNELSIIISGWVVI